MCARNPVKVVGGGEGGRALKQAFHLQICLATSCLEFPAVQSEGPLSQFLLLVCASRGLLLDPRRASWKGCLSLDKCQKSLPGDPRRQWRRQGGHLPTAAPHG